MIFSAFSLSRLFLYDTYFSDFSKIFRMIHQPLSHHWLAWTVPQTALHSPNRRQVVCLSVGLCSGLSLATENKTKQTTQRPPKTAEISTGRVSSECIATCPEFSIGELSPTRYLYQPVITEAYSLRLCT